MTLKRPVALLAVVSMSTCVVAVSGWLAGSVTAQSGRTFTARLAWVPTTPADRPDVTGKGSVTATLSGATLSIDGSFEGLAAPATAARLHRGLAVGARGIPVADLTIAKATGGSISGTVSLTNEQVDSLRAGTLYVQVHSEKGVDPDGSTLWGWLLEGKK